MKSIQARKRTQPPPEAKRRLISPDDVRNAVLTLLVGTAANILSHLIVR